MSTPRWILMLLVAAGLSVAGGYWLAQQRLQDNSSPTTTTAERKPLYWYDPMKPDQHFDKPGKSPYMDMQLVAKYADEGSSDATAIQIDPGITQNLGVRLTVVKRGAFAQPVQAVGTLVYNQRNVAVVQARTNGFVTRVYARAPGDVLPRDAALVDLLVPEWAAAQAEFVALLKHGDAPLVQAARERLVLLGMSPELIKRIEGEQSVINTITIRTPIAGAMASLDVREGMTVSAGATLATINGLDTIWLDAALPEAQGVTAVAGKNVAVNLAAFPAETFTGKVVAVLPETNAETRTLRVRIELQNPAGKLRPGMFAQAQLDAGAATPVLYVASEAIIRTGTRNIVLLADGKGSFTPTTVQVGAEVQGNTVVLSGLSEGQSVVASGQFLIDSEASLQGVLARMTSTQSATTSSTAATLHVATGRVESVTADTIVVSHGPVKSLEWPAMTMGFMLPHAELAAGIKPGDMVTMHFKQDDTGYTVERLERTP